MRFSLFSSLLVCAGLVVAAPPTDPKDLAMYNHCQDWLKNFPAAYIATNIRGDEKEYAMRRQVALDMLRQKRDFGTVYELMTDLDKGNPLSDQIIDVLVEWKSRRAIPLLQQMADDKKRPKALRAKAQEAVTTLTTLKQDAPPVFH